MGGSCEVDDGFFCWVFRVVFIKFVVSWVLIVYLSWWSRNRYVDFDSVSRVGDVVY